MINMKLFKLEGGWCRKWGPSIFFFSTTWGALKGQKEGWGKPTGFLIKARNFHLSYFGIMFERGP